MAVFAHTLKGIDGRPWCQPWRAYIEVKRRSCSRFWVPSFVGRKGPPSPCLVYDMHGVYKSTHCLVYDLGCQILYCLSTTTLLIVIMLRIKTLASNRRGGGVRREASQGGGGTTTAWEGCSFGWKGMEAASEDSKRSSYSKVWCVALCPSVRRIFFSWPIAAWQWQKGPHAPTTSGTVSGPRRTPHTLNYMYNFCCKRKQGNKRESGIPHRLL